MGDDKPVISSGQAITPETLVNHSFTAAFRGYHPVEVRQLLKQVSDELAAGAGREAELQRALQEAQEQAAHPELDEASLTAILGEHAARLLTSARETAASITEDARRQAEEQQRLAEARIGRMREEADGLLARRVAEADASAESIQRAAEAEAASKIEQATLLGKEMVAEARAVRERMLGDLSRRRRSAQVQIEQLRAARDRLVAAYDVVRRTVEEATAELDAAEPEARLAAEAAGRRAEDLDDALAGEGWPAALVPREAERTLVAASVGPGRREAAASAPTTSLFRRVDPSSLPPAPPERPHLRPQTVADAAGGRSPAPAPAPATATAPPPAPPRVAWPDVALPPAPSPVAPDIPPTPPASVSGVSELATSEVPVVTVEGAEANVDQLFARIRADRVTPAVEAPTAPAVQAPTTPAPDPIVVAGALEGRDDLLDNLEAGLARALKRVLGDEQNEVLDSLRRLGASAGAAILPDPQSQTARYGDAAVPWLQQAVRAGVGFVSDAGVETAAVPPEADAGTLARDLVGPLRERLTRALEQGADADDPSVAAESFRATYRQWKVQQVEEAARHHVVTAFNLGAFTAMPDEAVLQWLVDDEGHCPDCDDNALAGPTVKGQAFPTGQLHPPAHPGCRCLLVPVTG